MNKRNGWLALGLLLAVTLIVYLPVRHHEFVAYDDADYVTENPHVQAGLTLSGLKWAFTTGHASNWHPVTWISHMLDTGFFGRSSAGPHLVNVLLHLANTLLLFVLLRRLSGAVWRSLLVAALFSLHPLRIESVAWVAERKDVLSAFFFLLTLLAYASYANPAENNPRHRVFGYGTALVLFSLGLMSKPMLVTLPCVLLLLDVWPLQRLRFQNEHTGLKKWAPLIREKIPFFLLSIASCVVTIAVQQRGGAVRSLESFSWGERAGNAVVACAGYLGKTIWPTDLAVFYPHPGHWPVAWVAGSALLVLGLSVLAAKEARRAPFVTTGWFWFLGMLVPTLGLVQVGNQSMADRYMYLPSIGLFIVIVWSLAIGAVRWRLPRFAVPSFAVIALVTCGFATARQLPHWRDSQHLFARALEVTERNFVAHNGMGYLHLTRNQPNDAIAQFRHAIEIQPRFAEAYTNLGNALLQKGRDAEATASFQKALEIQPTLAEARYNLGTLLHAQGRPAEAVIELTKAADLRPEDAVTRVNLGNALLSLGKLDDAALAYREALRLQPDYADAANNLGYVLLQSGQTDEAVAHFQKAVKIQPTHANAYYNLGDALRRQGRVAEAATAFEQTVALQPADSEAKALLDTLNQELGRPANAAGR